MSKHLDIIIDKLTNSIEHYGTGIQHDTEALLLSKSDLKLVLKKHGWLFKWNAEYALKNREVYKLFIANDTDQKIQGLISLEIMPDHVYIHLIENAPQNRSKESDSYIGVGGNLVALACKRSMEENFEHLATLRNA